MISHAPCPSSPPTPFTPQAARLRAERQAKIDEAQVRDVAPVHAAPVHAAPVLGGKRIGSFTGSMMLPIRVCKVLRMAYLGHFTVRRAPQGHEGQLILSLTGLWVHAVCSPLPACLPAQLLKQQTSCIVLHHLPDVWLSICPFDCLS